MMMLSMMFTLRPMSRRWRGKEVSMRGGHLTGLRELKRVWLSNMPNTWPVEATDEYGQTPKDAKFFETNW